MTMNYGLLVVNKTTCHVVMWAPDQCSTVQLGLFH